MFIKTAHPYESYAPFHINEIYPLDYGHSNNYVTYNWILHD